MISGILRFILNLASWIISIAGWALLIYVILRLVIPNNTITTTVGRFVEPMLNPVRALIRKFIPSLAGGSFDFSPIGLWLIFEIASWLIGLLARII